jgi:hypothetical protein
LVYGTEHEFVSLERELQPPGALTQPTTTFPFDFSSVEKVHESYNGMNVTLRYFLRVTISRSLAPNITHELDLWVRSPAVPASAVTDFNPIKMEARAGPSRPSVLSSLLSSLPRLVLKTAYTSSSSTTRQNTTSKML